MRFARAATSFPALRGIRAVDELKIRFRIPPGMDVVPGITECDSSEFRISPYPNQKGNRRRNWCAATYRH